MNAIVKGAKAGNGETRKAKIAADSAQSKTYIKILYGLSEGEVEGLVNGLQSVYLEDTPLLNVTGVENFEDVTSFFRYGTNDQEHIEGFPDISSETAISVELKSETPWVKSISNTDLDAVVIRLKWGALRQTNDENGDVKGYTIKYAIDLQTDGGTWLEYLNTQISDKTSANYERAHRIELPQSNTGWTVRVRRITPNSDSEYISDKMYVEALTEVIDLKLNYPNTALLGLHYDAETFSNVAKLAVDLKGIKIKIPSNYDPVTRAYVGLWDGTFKRAYTNNPAWIYYDICTAKRYALGDRLTQMMIDKWSLYRLAQYCDQEVDNGKGGKEPRFTCNVYLQSTEDAYSILTKLAGIFRAISYWDGNSIVCDADIPQDTFFTYTRANVIDGSFEYTGTRARDRHTVAKVAWDNPQNHYKTEYVYVRDEDAISRLGIRTAEIEAWGCTSEGQAQRAGHWALKSEQYETRTVTFKVGLDGYIPQPGKVIEIADELFAGRANGGRISAVSPDLKTITLDRDNVVCRAGDRLVVNGEDGQAQARIVSSVSGRKVKVVSAFNSVAVQNVWVVDAQDLKTMKFRVMSIVQNELHQFTITALQYEESKYDAIDYGAFIQDRPISIINPTIQDPVKLVTITSETMVQQGLSIETMFISWDQVTGATKYQVEWRKDDGSWLKLPITGANSVEVQGIYAGNYQARVTAINAFDSASLSTYSLLTTLIGKQGLPPELAFIQASGVLFGMQIDWGFPSKGALDTAYTEVEVSPDGKSNIAQLGLFAYPTSTHTIQGLQGNLKQKYRGRLIDRIGNIGAWSEWVEGIVSADASDVLELLDNQISNSQLDQSLKEKVAKIDLIEGIENDISDIILSVEHAENGLTQERNERISGDNQVLNELTIYKLSNDQKVAAVVEDIELIVNDQQIISQKVDGVYAQVNPELIGSTSDLIGSEQGYAGVWSLQSAMIEGDMAEAKRTEQVVAKIAENDAIYQQKIQANADSISANVKVTETIQTTVNGNTASIQEVSQSVDGLYAQKFTKLDVNGKVIGWGGANDGVEGKFIFNVDALAIGSGNSTGYYPFIFRTTPYTDPLTGTIFPVSAYLSSAMMDYASIKTAHIEDLAVKTAKIDDLAVNTAKIDNLAVTEGKIANLAVDTLKIKDNAVTVPVSAFAEASMTVGSSYTTIQTLNVPSDMGHTILTFGAVFSFSSYDYSQRLLCRVLKNGNVVLENLEVFFLDSVADGRTSNMSGSHDHSLSLSASGNIGSSGSHSHSVNGSTDSQSTGTSGSNHSHGLRASTSSDGSHNHSISISVSGSTTGSGGGHQHTFESQSKSKGAGTLNISRHDSTGIAGKFELQLMVAAGSNAAVSQRYIHAMTMRK